MQSRPRKSERLAAKQLLHQVNRSYCQLTKENEEPVHRSRSTTPKSVAQRRLKSQTKKELAKSVERDLSPVKGSLYLGSRSIQEDKDLLKVGKKNAAVLAYLQGKLQQQSMLQGKEGGKRVLSDDVLLFTKAVLNETNLKYSDNGHLNQEKPGFEKPLPKPRPKALESSSPAKIPQKTEGPCFGHPTALKGCTNMLNNQEKIDIEKLFPRPKPKALDPVLPNQLNEQGLSPCFGQKKSAKEVLEGANRKYKTSEQKNSVKLKSKRRLFSNTLCFNVLIINLALLSFALWPLLSSEVNQGKEIVPIAEGRVGDKEVPLSEQDRLESLNLEFQKLNQELEAYISNIENPKESSYNFKSLLPLSIISIGLQLLAWMVVVSVNSS